MAATFHSVLYTNHNNGNIYIKQHLETVTFTSSSSNKYTMTMTFAPQQWQHVNINTYIPLYSSGNLLPHATLIVCECYFHCVNITVTN